MLTPAQIIDHILEHLGWNTVELADFLGVTKQAVSYWRGKKYMSKKILTSLEKLQEKGIRREFVENGSFPVAFLDGRQQTHEAKRHLMTTKELQSYELQDETESYNKKEIPFIDDVEVFATISPAMADAVAMRANTFGKIPIFSKGEFAIQVKGNSMKGYINHGDWIVIRRLYDADRIIYGEPYVVCTKTNDLRTVKFVKEHEDKNLLWLCPYNIEQFEAQAVEKEDIVEIYAIEGLFRNI